jgi:hypothetical protein
MALRGSGTPGDNIGTTNVAIGYQAGYSNSSGNLNMFLGHEAGYQNTTGSQNFFVGFQSGYANLTGADNLFIGSSSGDSNMSGSSNIFLGTLAGETNTTGSSNIIIGYNADVATDSTSNAVALGHDSIASSNEFALADSITYWKFQGDSYTLPTAFPAASGYVLVSSDAGVMTWEDPSLLPSDASLKTSINSISYGLETVHALNPVAYNLVSSGRSQIGFIAQEVEAIVPEVVGVIAGGKKGVQYGQLSAVIVKAIQELDIKVQNLELLSGEGKSVAGQLADMILRVKSIVFGSSENPSGFTMYDTVTKEPYCVTLANGDFVKTPGECGLQIEGGGENGVTDSNTSDSESAGEGDPQSGDVTFGGETSENETTTLGEVNTENEVSGDVGISTDNSLESSGNNGEPHLDITTSDGNSGEGILTQ